MDGKIGRIDEEGHMLLVEEHAKETKRTTRDALLAKSRITRIHSLVSRLQQTQRQTLVEMSTRMNHTGFLCVKQFM